MVYLTWSFPLLTGSSALLFHSLSFPLLSLSFVSCFLFLFPVVFLIFSGYSALLFHSLSVPLLSLSFVSGFLFLFPVVFLCLFNPFSLSISFHFFPLSLFCFSMLLYPLCSLCSLSLSLLSLLSLSLSPSLSSTLFFLLVFYSRLPGCRVPLLLFPQAFRSVSGSVLWKQQESTVNLPDGNGNQLFTIQSLILQSEEGVSEKRESEKKEDPSRQESGEVIRIQRCMMMQLLSTLATLLPPSLGFGTWPGSWLPYQKVVKGVQGTAPFGVPSERWATGRPGRQYL